MKTTAIFYRICNSFPVWTGTAIVLSLILLLTLMPSSDVPSVGIPHIDKVVHFMMFGALSSVILIDYSRYKGRLDRSQWAIIAALSAAIGGGVELLQESMSMGRGAELSDFIADTLGAFLLPLCCWPFFRRLVFEYSLSFRDVSKGSRLPKIIVDLYIASFPPDERRPLNSIRGLIDRRGPFHFSLIRSAGKIVGFITWWSLEKGIYVEHFAVRPELRSHGYGRLAMDRFCSFHENRGIILEVEMPGSNEMADRRIGFYERCGFRTHPEVHYLQPPYSPELQPVKLLLMTCGPVKDVAGLAKEIKRRVYGVK